MVLIMIDLILQNICHSSLISFKIMQPCAANCHQCSFMVYNENVLVVVTILGGKNQKGKVEFYPALTTFWEELNLMQPHAQWRSKEKILKLLSTTNLLTGKKGPSIFDKSQWQSVRSILEMIYLIGSQGRFFHSPHCAPQCQLKYCSAASLRSVLESPMNLNLFWLNC